MSARLASLRRLARQHGILTSYRDDRGRENAAPPDSIIAALKALGVPLSSPRDAPELLRAHRRTLWHSGLEPVHVAWTGIPLGFTLRLPAGQAADRASCTLRPLEKGRGEDRCFECLLTDTPSGRTHTVEGEKFVEKHLSLPVTLPLGYYELGVGLSGRIVKSFVISAPRRVPSGDSSPPRWGVFLPLYALRSRRSWGIGDFSDLGRLCEWAGRVGSSFLGTLPLQATFLRDPFDPSPYAPASRLFWNEIFLDVPAAAEFRSCRAAHGEAEHSEFRARVESLNGSELVDYREVMRVKRAILEEMCRFLHSRESERAEAFRRFLRERPEVGDYSRFRAVADKLRRPWPEWPEPLRSGTIGPGDYHQEDARYHAYVQWIAEEQLRNLARRSDVAGVDLYLDLPIGVHPAGYDVYRERESFVTGASAGAPPDSVFADGQDWGFPPLHPHRIREQGYRHFIDVLRRLLALARILRVDHVMGFHRIFLIPPGGGSRDGVYLRYRPEESYAILCLEAQRSGSAIVGEDLGTVPPGVRRDMARHGLNRMYVLALEMDVAGESRLPDPSRASLAGLNTHDMPPFAAFWRDLDLEDRMSRGLLSAPSARQVRKRRGLQKHRVLSRLRKEGRLGKGDSLEHILRACLCRLAAGRSPFLQVNLEDLWLETRPQNVPGTFRERPNWMRKARYTLEAIETGAARGLEALDHVREARNKKRGCS